MRGCDISTNLLAKPWLGYYSTLKLAQCNKTLVNLFRTGTKILKLICGVSNEIDCPIFPFLTFIEKARLQFAAGSKFDGVLWVK